LIVKQSSLFGSHLGHMDREIFFGKCPGCCPNGGLRKIRKKSGLRRELFADDERNQRDALKMAT
jgi:hypothetical protein